MMFCILFYIQGNLQSWLLNKECLDQLSVIYERGEKTSIIMNSTPEFSIVEERKVKTLKCYSGLFSYIHVMYICDCNMIVWTSNLGWSRGKMSCRPYQYVFGSCIER